MIIPTERNMRRILALHIAATRGGITRLKILQMLDEKPKNINELATGLRMDYKTVQHHIRVLEKSGLIVSEKKNYGNAYMLSGLLQQYKNILSGMFANMGKDS